VTQEMALRTYVGIEAIMKNKMRSPYQGCHKGHFWMKITVRTSARVRVYPADAVKTASVPRPRGRGSPRMWTRADVARTRVDTRRTATGPRERGAASARMHGHGGQRLGFPL
jgi:hypothetical protein